MRQEKGFTLIELLIVIALIGILAVALLSTINPLEQTRKAKDSERKSAAAELLSSIERFQSTYYCWPWEYTGTPPACVAGTALAEPGGTVGGNNATALQAALVENSSEMKGEFFGRDVIDQLYINVDTDNLVHICYEPESKTFLSQAASPSAGEGCDTGTTCVCVPE